MGSKKGYKMPDGTLFKIKLRDDWDKIKDDVMYGCLVLKFKDPVLREALLATKNIPLVEGNYWHDNYWGNCYCLRCSNKPSHNKLGHLLMRVRREILEGII